MLDDGVHLVHIGGEVKPGLCALGYVVVSEEVVESEVTCVVGHRVNPSMREVTEQVTLVEARHSDFGNYHF